MEIKPGAGSLMAEADYHSAGLTKRTKEIEKMTAKAVPDSDEPNPSSDALPSDDTQDDVVAGEPKEAGSGDSQAGSEESPEKESEEVSKEGDDLAVPTQAAPSESAEPELIEAAVLIGDAPVAEPEAPPSTDPFDDFEDDDFDDEFDDDFEEEWDDDVDDDGFGPEFQDTKEEEFDIHAKVTDKQAKEAEKNDKFQDDDDFDK